MAFGVHWEWRGFAKSTPDSSSTRCLEALKALPRRFSTSQVLTDHYLWVPGASVNVKLRLGDLKFKRLLETSEDYQRWVELEEENHPFPLAPSVLEGLFESLRISLRSTPGESLGRQGLLDLIEREAPSVRLVSVRKERDQYDWTGPDGPMGEGVIVEVARIHSPERLTSVGLEHPELPWVRAARDALKLARSFRSLSYLGAVASWGRGERIAS